MHPKSFWLSGRHPILDQRIANGGKLRSAGPKWFEVWGDIGELFGAITYGIKLNRTYAQGADGRLGNDHVEIKTITPFKKKDEVLVDLSGHFIKLLVVKINEAFQVCGRMVDRRSLPTPRGRYLRVRWADLPSSTSGS